MKRFFFLLCALSLLLTIPALTSAQAAGSDKGNSVKQIAEGMRKPIVLESSVSPLLNVTFNHRTHMSVPCQTCHHAEGSKGKYSSCRECHETPGPREEDVMSQFYAFHAKGTDRSCYGCHQKLAEARPQDLPHFTNCRPCHMSDEARAKARAQAMSK